MPSDHDTVKMADALIVAHHHVMEAGTSEMQALSRLLLHLAGRQIADISKRAPTFEEADPASPLKRGGAV